MNRKPDNLADRETLRKEFIGRCGWGDAQVLPLVPDASFRCYYRLTRARESVMLMDAPPEQENARAFLKVTELLARAGIRVPAIHASDPLHGFILMEDLGDETFTALLQSGASERDLYDQAVSVLLKLHGNREVVHTDLGEYNFEALLREARLFVEWYLPATRGGRLSRECESGYDEAWQLIYQGLPDLPPTLVVRDYHVDNLMLVNGQCVLLDYQDALVGSPAYDVVSLLEDARRDIDAKMAHDVLERYLGGRPGLDRRDFMHHYAAWGAQRHCKVAGIFTRLWLRDNKPAYLRHLSRVLGLLQKNVEKPPLEPLRQWFVDNDIILRGGEFEFSRGELIKLMENEPTDFSI